MRGNRRILLFLPLLAFLAFFTLRHSPPGLVSDEAAYVGYAERITHGHYANGLDVPYPYLWYGPGLPLVLAPLAAIGASIDVIRLVGPVAIFGAAVAFDALVRPFAGDRFALLGAYALGLYPPFFAGELLQHTFSEPVALLSVTVGLLFMARAVRSGAKRDVLISGLGFGWLALTRVGFGWILIALLVIFAVLYFVRRRRRRPAAIVAGRVAAVFAVALLVCTPWLVYTYSLTHRPLYWSNSGGANLYWMASPYPGDLGDWKGTLPTRPEHARFFRSLDGLGPVAVDVQLQRRAAKLIYHHPSGYLGNLPPNISRLVLDLPFTPPPSKSFTARFGESPTTSEALRYAIPNVLILGLLAMCLPALLRARLPPEALPFATFAGVSVAFHSALATEGRMLVPVIPVLLWFLVYALAQLNALPLPAALRRTLGLAVPARS